MKKLLMIWVLASLVACGDPVEDTGLLDAHSDASVTSRGTPDGGAAEPVGTLDAASPDDTTDRAAPETAEGLPDADPGTANPEDTSDLVDAGLESSPPDVAAEVDTSIAVDGNGDGPEGEDQNTVGGGLLLFELASSMLNQAGAGARFTLPEEGPVGDQEVYGTCTVTPADPDGPEASPVFGYDAGDITVGGTTPAVTLVAVDEGDAGTGYVSGLAEDLESLLPAGGSLLNISAQGGADIPAFSMYLQVPEQVTVTTPETGLFASVSTASPLEVTWNQGTGEMVLVTFTPLSATFQPIAGDGLVCQQDDDLGSLSVPVAALQAMKTSGVSKVAIGVTRMRTSTANAGSWVVPAAVTRSSGGLLSLD
ncbi:MAG: hypothetical protein ACPGU1_11590 [Myxococcota bacterium]